MALTVLHISESDAAGGAGAAAYRLHHELHGLGHRSRMLVGRRVTDDPDVRTLKRNAAWRAADRASGEALDRLGLQYVFYPSSFGVVRRPLVSRGRRRPAAQPARQLLLLQRAPGPLATASASSGSSTTSGR